MPDAGFPHRTSRTELTNIRDERAIYLDLAQQEGSVGDSTNLSTQLLIALVYARAKETEKEVVFYIDESRYVLQDAANLTSRGR